MIECGCLHVLEKVLDFYNFFFDFLGGKIYLRRYLLRKFLKIYRGPTGHVQSAYKAYIERLKSTYRVHIEHPQGIYRAYTEYLQGTYRTISEAQRA